MSWPALLEAKENARNISLELDRMLKDANSLSKKDIARYKETLLAEIDRSVGEISAQIAELKLNLKNHRKYFEAKSAFVKRHYSRKVGSL